MAAAAPAQIQLNLNAGGANNVAGGGNQAPVANGDGVDPVIAATTKIVQDLALQNKNIGFEREKVWFATEDQTNQTKKLESDRVALIKTCKQALKTLESMPQVEGGALQQAKESRSCKRILSAVVGIPTLLTAGLGIASAVTNKSVANLWSSVPSSSQLATTAGSHLEKAVKYFDCNAVPKFTLRRIFQETFKTALNTTQEAIKSSEENLLNTIYNLFSDPNIVQNATQISQSDIAKITQFALDQTSQHFGKRFIAQHGLPCVQNVTQADLNNATRIVFDKMAEAFVQEATNPEFKQSLPCRVLSTIKTGLEDASWLDKIKALNLENIWNFVYTNASELSNQYLTDLNAAWEGELSNRDTAVVALKTILLLYTLSRVPFLGKVVNRSVQTTANAIEWTGKLGFKAIKGVGQAFKWSWEHRKHALAISVIGFAASTGYLAKKYF